MSFAKIPEALKQRGVLVKRSNQSKRISENILYST
jgi:hypothetical protein